MKLKFLCINLWQGGNLFEEILAFIRAENPDVIAMQEVYDGHDPSWERKYRSMDELRAALGYPYEHFSPAFLEIKDFGKIEQGNAVLSRFPILGSDTVFFDIPYGEREEIPVNFPTTPRSLEHVRLGLNGTELSVFNTQGVWGEDGRDNERRINMGKVIAAQVADKAPVILAGDFNVNPDTETIAQIERELTNVFKGELVTTFNMKHKTHPGFATAVVDMMFVSADVTVLAHNCPQVNVTDHLPLLATFEIR